MEPMTNDAMTKADAARERVFALLAEYAPLDGPESVEVDEALQAYGDRRAVEAEIAAYAKMARDWFGSEQHEKVARYARSMLADAEQRLKDL